MENKMQWFLDAKFGMIIHWGLYSVLAGEYKGQKMDYIGEWIMSRFKIPLKEYEKLAADFDIYGFDAEKLVLLAKNAGMKYIIFSAKHHEGFAMYHSKADKFNITDMSPSHRDPLRELADACEKYDMRLCLYYSQALDWHEENAGGGTDASNKGMFWGNNWDFPDQSKKDFSIYFENKCKKQLKELLSEYGKIHLLWFDCAIGINEQQCRELYDLVKEYQPDCIVNSRIGHGIGDYESLGDNLIPAGKIKGIWESVTTLNDTWGYKYFDNNWKPSAEIIAKLSGLASKGINFVINIGPDGHGFIPEPSIKILNEVGEWVKKNGEAIYGTRLSPFDYDFPFGYLTQKGNDLYIIISDNERREINISGVRSAAKCALLLENKENVKLLQEHTEENILKIYVPEICRDLTRPVIKVEFAEPVSVEKGIIEQYDGSVRMPATVCDIHNSDREIKKAETSHRETDAQAAVVTNKISIFQIGCTQNWFDTDNFISWDFKTFHDGDYEIEITTSGYRHEAEWKGGHTVNVEVDGKPKEMKIVSDRRVTDPDARYYTAAVTDGGAVHIEKGKHTLALKAIKIENNDDVGLTVISVDLIRKQIRKE